MKLSQNQLKIGPIKVGGAQSFSVDITNDSTVTVSGIETGVGCGACTSASVGPKVLKSGESTKLSVTFTSKSTGANMPKTVTISYIENGQPKQIVFTFLVTVTN
jgi:hypothetical protein